MPEERARFGELLIGILDRPAATLANIVAYPRWRWLFPALLAIAALALYLALAAPLLAVQAQQQSAAVLARIPAAQQAQVQAQMATFQSPRFMIVSGLGVGLLSLVIGWLIQTAILYFGALIGGGDLQFGGVFAATPWLGIPFALENLLQALYIRVNGKLLANQGLGYFLSTGNILQDQRNLAYVALSQVTLFRLWHLVLVYALFRGAAHFSRSAAFWLTMLYLLLTLGGQLGLSALSRLLSPV